MRYILQPYWLLDSLNKTAYIKEHFTTSGDLWNRIYKFLSVYKRYLPCYYRNKNQVENTM